MTRAPRFHGQQRSRGFTLIELMIGLVILTVGVLGLASGMASVSQRQELATNRAEMLHLADSKMERLRGAAASRSVDTVQLAVGGSITVAMAAHADTVLGRGRLYQRLWEVAAGPWGATGPRQVTVRVRPIVDERRTPARLDFTSLIHILSQP